MPIFHFIYDLSCERKRKIESISTLLVLAEDYRSAYFIAENYIKKRKKYTGRFEGYNLGLDYVESENPDPSSDD